MNQDTIEKLAFVRQLELLNEPNKVSQTFDVNHLKSLHAYLFQDSQNERLSGQFRPHINDVHSKNRSDIYDIRKPFYYDPKPNEDRIAEIIKQTNNSLSSNISFDKKTEALATLYVELDYQHPFTEGNSRTIRLFCEQLAQQHDIQLDWRPTSQNKAEFYRARDFEIAKKNSELKPSNEFEEYMLEEAKRHKTQDYIANQISMNKGRYISQIIKDCCEHKTQEQDLANVLSKEYLKNNYPTLTEAQIFKIDLVKNKLLERYTTSEAQTLAMEQLHKQIPDIASGKIILPDLPSDKEKSKGIDR